MKNKPLKNTIIYVVIIILLLITLFKFNVFDKEENFKIFKTEKINKIFISDMYGNNITIEKEIDKWKLNNKYEANLEIIERLISDLGKKLSDFQEFESRANSIYLELNELFVDLSKKHPDADFDPYKMEQLNEKLLVINSLSKKFNVDSLAGLIQKKQEILAELSSFEGVVEEKNQYCM